MDELKVGQRVHYTGSPEDQGTVVDRLQAERRGRKAQGGQGGGQFNGQTTITTYIVRWDIGDIDPTPLRREELDTL